MKDMRRADDGMVAKGGVVDGAWWTGGVVSRGPGSRRAWKSGDGRRTGREWGERNFKQYD